MKCQLPDELINFTFACHMQWQTEQSRADQRSAAQEAAMETGHQQGQPHYNYDAVAFNYIPQRVRQQNNAHVAHSMLHVAREMRMNL